MEQSSLWGIDLGQESLTAVFLQRISGRYEISKAVRIDYELPLSGQYPPEKRDILEKAFRSLREREGIGTEQPVAIAISGLEAKSLPVRLPPVSKRLEDLVDLEVAKNPPIPGKEFLYRFQMLPTDSLAERRIFLIAYPKVEIDAVLDAAARAKLRVLTVQSSPASLANYLRFDLRNLEKTLVVHLRRDATDLVFGTEAGIWFRTIPEGANTLRAHLRQELGVSIPEAREILEDFLRGVPRAPYTIACDEFLERIQKELQEALDYQFLHFSFSQPERVLVLGECARVPGTLTHFSQKFRCWVERIEKAQRMSASEAVLASMPGKSLPACAAAIGVALQGMGAVAGTPSFANGDARSSARGEPATLVAATTALSAAPAESQTHAALLPPQETAARRPAASLARVASIVAMIGAAAYASYQWMGYEETQSRLAQGQTKLVGVETQLSLRRQLRDAQKEIDSKGTERAALASFLKPEHGIAQACASLTRSLPGNAAVLGMNLTQEGGGALHGEIALQYPGTEASLRATLAEASALGTFRIEDLGSGRMRVVVSSPEERP